MSMRVVSDGASLRGLLGEVRRRGERIALVPTMGALHEGHLSLVDVARERCEVVVLSLFVNPRQFNSPEDLASYPRDLKKDTQLAAGRGVSLLFSPSVEEIYPESSDSAVSVKAGRAASGLEGSSRPGHFDSVVTVVSILFNIVRPDVAVFGEKDYQQLQVITELASDLHYGIEIVPAPLVRDVDGVALSSRNALLSESDRVRAQAISSSLFDARKRVQRGEVDSRRLISAVRDYLESEGSLQVDYVRDRR